MRCDRIFTSVEGLVTVWDIFSLSVVIGFRSIAKGRLVTFNLMNRMTFSFLFKFN